ncbi:MAG: hypothetical protein ACT452_06175 [Microthrixaceae bacterium]
MFTTGSKWFLGLGLVSLVLAAAYGWSTGGNELGPVTAGYWGGVGDHFGYTLLVSIGLAGIFLGLVSVAIRDAAPSALAEVAGTDVAPPLRAPAHPAYWPIVGAFGACLVVLGLVISNVMFVIGCFVLLAVTVEWVVLAWSDGATGDADTNRLVRNRLMGPFEVPLAGFLVVGGTVIAFSRILLTSSELGAVWVATGLGVVILTIGALVATKPRLSPNVVVGVLLVCAVGVVAAGVASAARGERVIEKHHTEAPGDEGGLRPHVAPGTQPATTTTTAAGAEGH